MPEAARRNRWLRTLVRLATLAVLTYLAFRLHALWREAPVDFSETNLALLAVAAGLSFSSVVGYGLVWPRILAGLGVSPPRRALGIFLQSQLGKYMPGSVWHYAGRVGLARSRGVPARTTLVSLGIEVGASVGAAALVGLFVLPVVFAVPLAAVVVVGFASGSSRRLARRALEPLGRVVRRRVPLAGSDVLVMLRGLPRAAVLYLPVWALYGLAFWMTARALFPVPAGEVLYFTAAFAIAWIAGMVVVLAPGGIGVREAVLVALLAPRIGEAEAIVVAAASRILLTTSDLAGGAGALAYERLAGRRDRVRLD